MARAGIQAVHSEGARQNASAMKQSKASTASMGVFKKYGRHRKPREVAAALRDVAAATLFVMITLMRPAR